MRARRVRGRAGVGVLRQDEGDSLEPSPFTLAFLDRCKHDAAPLDFFSWHTYTNDPWELVRRARAVRRLLDQRGFAKTESHLNEWSYLPSNDWEPMVTKDAEVRRRWFERLAGPEAASFAVASLLLLQDAPVDVTNYYSADIQRLRHLHRVRCPEKGLLRPEGVQDADRYALAPSDARNNARRRGRHGRHRQSGTARDHRRQ